MVVKRSKLASFKVSQPPSKRSCDRYITAFPFRRCIQYYYSLLLLLQETWPLSSYLRGLGANPLRPPLHITPISSVLLLRRHRSTCHIVTHVTLWHRDTGHSVILWPCTFFIRIFYVLYSASHTAHLTFPPKWKYVAYVPNNKWANIKHNVEIICIGKHVGDYSWYCLQTTHRLLGFMELGFSLGLGFGKCIYPKSYL